MTSKKKEQSISLDGKKVSLNFLEVDIKLVKPDFNNDLNLDAYGTYTQKKSLIEIQEGLNPLLEMGTVIHEILHFISYASNETITGVLKDDNDEERLVNNFSNLLVVLFRQNPWLLHYLQKKLADIDQNT